MRKQFLCGLLLASAGAIAHEAPLDKLAWLAGCWSQTGSDAGSVEMWSPLCRRHWATIEQSRLARGEKENAVSAHAQIEGCTVPGIKRY